MPYKMIWVPAPTDDSLVVHQEKPDGVCYECRYCGGWIEGRPNRFQEDTFAPLARRRGTVEHCRRCGEEINFFGVMS
jgi:hypothetical protein